MNKTKDNLTDVIEGIGNTSDISPDQVLTDGEVLNCEDEIVTLGEESPKTKD